MEKDEEKDRVLDIDMKYFLDKVPELSNDYILDRPTEEEFGMYVWSEERVRDFLEKNLGLSKERKLKGRIVVWNSKVLDFWKGLIVDSKLETPFEVIHVDSHVDLGTGYSLPYYIMDTLLKYPIEERMENSKYDAVGICRGVGIGDYLLFAIAYRWVSKLLFV